MNWSDFELGLGAYWRVMFFRFFVCVALMCGVRETGRDNYWAALFYAISGAWVWALADKQSAKAARVSSAPQD